VSPNLSAFRALFVHPETSGDDAQFFLMREGDARATAVHEAAHAVVATKLSVEVVDVTALPTPNRSFGHTNMMVDKNDAGGISAAEWQERRAIVAMAGALAELRYRGAIYIDGIPTDFHLALVSVARAQEQGRQASIPLQAYLDAIVQTARTKVHENWEQIQSVARALTRCGTLTGAQVSALIEHSELRATDLKESSSESKSLDKTKQEPRHTPLIPAAPSSSSQNE
jgi:hypothetical protein